MPGTSSAACAASAARGPGPRPRPGRRPTVRCPHRDDADDGGDGADRPRRSRRCRHRTRRPHRTDRSAHRSWSSGRRRTRPSDQRSRPRRTRAVRRWSPRRSTFVPGRPPHPRRSRSHGNRAHRQRFLPATAATAAATAATALGSGLVARRRWTRRCPRRRTPRPRPRCRRPPRRRWRPRDRRRWRPPWAELLLGEGSCGDRVVGLGPTRRRDHQRPPRRQRSGPRRRCRPGQRPDPVAAGGPRPRGLQRREQSAALGGQRRPDLVEGVRHGRRRLLGRPVLHRRRLGSSGGHGLRRRLLRGSLARRPGGAVAGRLRGALARGLLGGWWLASPAVSVGASWTGA